MAALLLVPAACATLAFSNHAGATTMVPLDLPALTTRAEAVVAGRVTQSRSAWTEDHGSIYTDVTIHIDRVLKGVLLPGQDVVIRREGGSVDGVGAKVFGAATFTVNEDVVVFIERRGASRYVVGMAQGKLSLYADVSGARTLRRDLSEVAYTRAPSTAERALTTQAGAQKPARAIVTLDDLAAEVARLDAKRPTP